MTYLGTAIGASIAAAVGFFSATNVRRPWTEVPWSLMRTRPEWFGGRKAVVRHHLYIFYWTVSLTAYSIAALAISSYVGIPILEEVYRLARQSIPPHIGLASEVLGAFGTALAAWKMAKWRVSKHHREVPSSLLDIPATSSSPVQKSFKRAVYEALAFQTDLLCRLLVQAIIPFYEHLWQRDGAILSGSATALLADFPNSHIRTWHKTNHHVTTELADDELAGVLISALRLPQAGGYWGLHTALMQARDGQSEAGEKREHIRKPAPGLAAHIHLSLGSSPFTFVTLVNYSKGGVAVRWPEKVALKSLLALRVQNTNYEVEVAHCHMCPAGHTDQDSDRTAYVVGLRLKTPFAGRSLCDAIEGKELSC